MVCRQKRRYPQQTEVDDTPSCFIVVLNSTSKLHFNLTLTPLLNSTYQLGEIWVHKLDLNSTFWIPVFTAQISLKYYPDITQISSRCHPDINNLVKIRVLTQIWHDNCMWNLHFETRLKLHFWKAKVEFYSI